VEAEPNSDAGFISLPAPGRDSGASGGNRSRVWAILAADGARERARARRNSLVSVLAALGLPVWIGAIWPARVAHEWRSIFAAAWAVAFGAVLLAMVGERIAHLRRARQIATLGPLPVLRSARRAATTPACAATVEDED
jgi:hypothetical protein